MEKYLGNKKLLVFITGGLVFILLILIIIQKVSQRSNENVPEPEESKVIQPTSVLPEKTYYREDTAPTGAAESTDRYHLKNFPDVYLSNQSPYSNDYFSITSEFVKIPKGHFQFLVEFKGKEQTAKEEFQKWLLSLGFSTAKISELDIVYKKPAD